MRPIHLIATVCLSCVLIFSLTQRSAAKDNEVVAVHMIPMSFADLAERLSPAVVNISTTQKTTVPQGFPEMPQFPEGSPFEKFFEEFKDRRGYGAPSTPASSLGSGFIIDAKNGYIVTNNHVVRDAEGVRVTFSNDVTVEAEIIGTDEKTDLAVLKIDTQGINITSVSFGDSDAIRVGDWTIAIGNPFGLGGTVTTGILSARARDINSGPYDDYLQTDASINRGNSGGPLFNLNGDVIGINTAIFSPTGGSVGIGFAIPSSLAQPVINQIIKYGRTRRGWLGVRIQSVTDEIAESLGLDHARGALVASVNKDGPALKGGIKAGDIILEFNGQAIKNTRALPRIVAENEIGTNAKVTFWRDGKEHTTNVTVAELEKAEEKGLLTASTKSTGSGVKIDGIGMTLKPLDDTLRQSYKISKSIEGVVVSHIDNLSEAAKKGLKEGDVIVEVRQEPVSEPQNVIDIIEREKKSGKKSVLLLVNDAGNVRFVVLRIASGP